MWQRVSRFCSSADTVFLCMLQEDMYSFVTYSDDQVTKGKGTTVVEA